MKIKKIICTLGLGVCMSGCASSGPAAIYYIDEMHKQEEIEAEERRRVQQEAIEEAKKLKEIESKKQEVRASVIEVMDDLKTGIINTGITKTSTLQKMKNLEEEAHCQKERVKKVYGGMFSIYTIADIQIESETTAIVTMKCKGYGLDAVKVINAKLDDEEFRTNVSLTAMGMPLVTTALDNEVTAYKEALADILKDEEEVDWVSTVKMVYEDEEWKLDTITTNSGYEITETEGKAT